MNQDLLDSTGQELSRWHLWCQGRAAPAAVAQVLVALSSETIEEAREAVRKAKALGLEPHAWADWAARSAHGPSMDALMAEGCPPAFWRAGEEGVHVAACVTEEKSVAATKALLERGVSAWHPLPWEGDNDRAACDYVPWLIWALRRDAREVTAEIMNHAQASLTQEHDPQDLLDRALMEIACSWSTHDTRADEHNAQTRQWAQQLMSWGANPRRWWPLGDPVAVPAAAPAPIRAVWGEQTMPVQGTVAHLWVMHRSDWLGEWPGAMDEPWLRDTWDCSPAQLAAMMHHPVSADCDGWSVIPAQGQWTWIDLALDIIAEQYRLFMAMRVLPNAAAMALAWKYWRRSLQSVTMHDRLPAPGDMDGDQAEEVQPNGQASLTLSWKRWARWVTEAQGSVLVTGTEEHRALLGRWLDDAEQHVTPWLNAQDRDRAQKLVHDFRATLGQEQGDEAWAMLENLASVENAPLETQARTRL